MNGIYQRVLSFGPLVYLGRISYGIYVYHVFVIICVSPFLARFGMSQDHLGPLRLMILLAITLVLSALITSIVCFLFLDWFLQILR